MELPSSDTLSGWIAHLLLGDTLLLMCGMFVAVGFLERFRPANSDPKPRYGLNFCYALVNIVLVATIAPLLSAATAYAIGMTGFGLIDLRALGFDGLSGALLAMLVGTLVYDLFQYVSHRAYHASSILWQQHLLHHSDECMNVLTAQRHHVFDFLLLPIFVTIPMAILFKLPPVTIAAVSLIPIAWQYVAHANIRLGFGPLWWLLVSPNYHRIHHSLDRQHQNKNFAAWFPVWDIIFGTAWKPRRGECPATGVAGVTVRTLWQAVLLPLMQWRRMFAARWQSGGAADRAV